MELYEFLQVVTNPLSEPFSVCGNNLKSYIKHTTVDSITIRAESSFFFIIVASEFGEH